jgi:hypothetical protein
MILNRNRLYSIMLVACVAGYIWLYFAIENENSYENQIGVCLIKHITNIPCPSCGSTRSIILLARGNIIQSVSLNPIGVIVAVIMLLSPAWIIFDITTRRKTLFDFYQKTETVLRRPQYAMPLVMLVTCNWIWNIIKGI